MVDPLTFLGGVVVVLGLGMIFVLSLAEASLLAASDLAMRRLAEQGRRGAVVVQRLKCNEEYLSAIIVGINACVVLVSTMTTVLVHRHLPSGAAWQAELWHFGTIAAILVLAEITPKTWGALMPERTAPIVAPAIQLLVRALAPVVRALTGVGNLLLRVTGSTPGHRKHFISAGEIQAAVDLGEEEGVVEPEEGEMLDNVIELGETVAREIIVPRVDIVAVPQEASVEEFVTRAVESGHSRIPIYKHTVDEITGIVYVTDVLRALRDGRRDFALSELARQPVFVPETKRVSELFRELRDKSVHIAVVVDEFGGTEGLVTIEDILEELVGEIQDEHDAPVDEVVVLSETEALVDGNARIDDLNDRLGLDLPEDSYETIGGLVAGEMGHIPQVGEELVLAGLRIVVEQGTVQHVEQVRITRVQSEGSDA